MLMVVIGISGAWDDVTAGTTSTTYQEYSMLLVLATGHFVYSLSYIFRGATYIDKWAASHTWTGIPGSILSWLHVFTEDPHVNIVVGSLMIIAGLPDVVRSLAGDAAGLVSPGSVALFFYGVFNVLKTLVPILMGVVYIHRGRLIRVQTEDPSPS